jgi:hypothetical protein
MKKALAATFLIIAMIAGGFTAGVLAERYRDERAAQEWPLESWQEVAPDKYYVISPPGSMWVFEIDEVDGKLQWRQFLMPIPREWSVPSNYEASEDREERWFRERERFDRRWGQDRDNPIVETSAPKKDKKKKPDQVDKDGVLQDSNRDGIVEFNFPLVYVEPEHEDGSPMLYTGWTHICCGCSLVHKIGLVVYWSGYQWRISQHWRVDEKESHWRRLKKFGGVDPWRVPMFTEPFDGPTGPPIEFQR